MSYELGVMNFLPHLPPLPPLPIPLSPCPPLPIPLSPCPPLSPFPSLKNNKDFYLLHSMVIA